MRCVLILLVVALQATAQTARSRPSMPPAGAHSRPPKTNDDPGARRLLERAAEAQIKGDRNFRVRDFVARLQVEVLRRDEQGSSRARTSSGRIEWRYQKRKIRRRGVSRVQERFYRHLKQPDGKELWLTFDGVRRLLKEKGSPTISLDEARFAKDREQLDEELALVRRLVDILILKRLLDSEANIRFGKRGVQVRTASGLHVCDEVIRDKAGDGSLSFFVGRERQHVHKVLVHPEKKGDPEEYLLFSHQRERLPLNDEETFDGILVPCVVEFYRAGRKEMKIMARNARAIVFNQGLGRSSFRPPER